jgi:phosphatidylinositol glycan class A protein
LDILYLGRIFPKHAAIMAKKSLRLLPGLGWFSESARRRAQLHISSFQCSLNRTLTLPVLLSGTVFIDRKNNKSAIASMTQAGEDMKRKRVSGARLGRKLYWSFRL